MNEGKLLTSLEQSIKLLKELNLLRRTNKINRKRASCKKFSESFKKIALKDDYLNIFHTGLKYNDYDILLYDHSYLQYSYEVSSQIIRMCYYPNPHYVKTYYDFLTKVMGFTDNEAKCDNNSFVKDFEQYLSEEVPKPNISPLRYDYNEASYDPVIHHASHLHIGLCNDIRIGIDKELTPFAFTCIVVNWFHFTTWKDNFIKIEEKVCHVKDLMDNVSSDYFGEKDKKYLYIH